MSDESETTHKRISYKNIDRVKKFGEFGESFNDVIGRILDKAEDVDRCLNGEEPQTDDLKSLKTIWYEDFEIWKE